MPKGPCAKQQVRATLVTFCGRRFVGTNDVENAQEVCPRDLCGMKTGEGYHLCKSICEQGAHAEVAAIRQAGNLTQGATIYLEGHTYACAPCLEAARSAGARIVIGPPPTASAR